MKTIGLIGGMSWESTDLYYQSINKRVQARLGGFHSAQIILYSVDFQIIEKFQRDNNWAAAGEYLAQIAKQLEIAGTDVIALCTNTMHKVAEVIEAQLTVPFMHIADSTIVQIQTQPLNKVALLGTRFTMEETFYRSRFTQQAIEVIIPQPSERQKIHDIIYDELCLGVVSAASKQAYLNIIHQLIKEGAEGVILGCTEISLLIHQQDLNVPVFDTAEIHVQALVNFALN